MFFVTSIRMFQIPGVHIENQPTWLLFPTMWTTVQLLPIITIMSCFVAGSSTGRWENPRAVGTWMAALARRGFGHFFWTKWQDNTSPVWDCRCNSRSSFEGKTVPPSAQPPTCAKKIVETN